MFITKKSINYLVFLILLSCQDTNQIKELEEKNKSLELENRKLNTNLTHLQNKIDSAENSKIQTEINEQRKLSGQSSLTYYFIVLDVTEKLFTTTGVVPGKKMYIASEIGEIKNYDDNIKYKLLDEEVENYKRNPSLSHRTTLNDRSIFTFDNYQQASEERESYILK